MDNLEAQDQINAYAKKATELIWDLGPTLVYAIVTLIVGLIVIKILTNLLGKILNKQKVDESLAPFLKSMFNITLKAVLVISVIEMIGIETTSFIALLGAAGLAIGMALSGTLQNFAGGVMVLIFKPYKIGDFIEAQGHVGIVKEIQIFNTILKTGDNKIIIIPNAPISSGSLINYSKEPTRRVDMTFGIGYNDDIDEAKSILQELLDNDERVLKDPATFIAVSELADSSVNFVVRAWTKSEDYWAVYFSMQEQVKKTFDQKGISIPYPQMDIHNHKVNQ